MANPRNTLRLHMCVLEGGCVGGRSSGPFEEPLTHLALLPHCSTLGKQWHTPRGPHLLPMCVALLCAKCSFPVRAQYCSTLFKCGSQRVIFECNAGNRRARILPTKTAALIHKSPPELVAESHCAGDQVGPNRTIW